LIEKSFKTNDITLSYDDGSGSGPPMILLHGLSDYRQAWQHNLIPAFGTTWHQYIFDQRGHGKSGRAADVRNYRLADYANDIIAFLQELDETAVIVGHSLGGMNAIGIGAMASDKVRGLILIDPPLFLRNQTIEARPDARAWFTWVYETTSNSTSFADVMTACRKLNPEADEVMLHNMATQVYGVAPGAVQIALNERLLEGMEMELSQALQQIKCPTLLVYGEWEQGAVIRDSDADFVRDNLAHVSIVKIQNGSHMFAWEKWAEVLPHIETFLAKV